jgi:mediator of RNA polymerase II transcription subunit 5
VSPWWNALTSFLSAEVRKAMLQGLADFVPTLQTTSIADRLELFRATAASFEPVDKAKDAAKGIDELLNSAVGHESLMLSELHIANTRAGLYIYLNACVSEQITACLILSAVAEGC